MSRIDSFGAGLILGLLFGAAHAAAMAVVAVAASPFVADVVLAGQVVRTTFAVEGVDIGVAAFLVVMTVFAGCAIGWLVAATWNGVANLRAAAPFRR